MRYKRKGEITVFLTLILTVIVGFYLSLSSLAQRYVAKSEATYALECAVRSCFAEYNRELFEKYHILLIDSSFMSPEGGIDRIEDHFSMYLTNSLVANEICDVSVSVREGTKPVKEKYGITEDVIGYMKENSSPGFDPENCFDDLIFTATFNSPSTGTYSITRQYSYEDKSM